MAKNNDVHRKFMLRAISLAKRAQGQTGPNPLVGACVVKNGNIVGQGYHRAAGLAHAEVVALEKAGALTKGARLYVSLEPCCHFGRTPPCVKKILQAGIKEVIFAMHDPNPLNNGKGAKILRQYGIKVTSGVLTEQAKEINQVFIKYITTQLPFVTVKVAQSLDGKIATASGHSRWISSRQSRLFVHNLRAQVDAILVGVNTVLADNPLLTPRLENYLDKNRPKKIVVDSKLRLSPKLRIFSAQSPAQVIVATTSLADQAKIARLEKQKARVLIVKATRSQVDLLELMKILAKEQLAHILIEGGGQIIASALEKKLVDRMIVIVAPKIIGGRNAPTAVEGPGVNRPSDGLELKQVRFKRLGTDLIIEGRPG